MIGNVLSAPPGGTRDALWFTELDAGPFEVRDNQINGTWAGGDRTDPFTYSFHGTGIRFQELQAAGTATGNTITGAYNGFSAEGGLAAVTGLDNVIMTVWSGAGVLGGGQLSINSSDFTDYIVPIVPAEPFAAGALTCNWWGDATGPSGVDPGVNPYVFTLFATAPVAGTSTTGC